MDVVREIVDMRKREGYPHPDEEQLELKRMGEEAEEWNKLAGLLLDDLAKREKEEAVREQAPSSTKEKEEEEREGEGKGRGGEGSVESEEGKVGSEKTESEGGQEVPDKLPDEMSVIGVDDNIHSKSLQQAIEEVMRKYTCYCRGKKLKVG